MDDLPIRTELAFATWSAAIFALGWLAQRFSRSKRMRETIEQLTDRIAHLECQSDATHRASLELAATHSRLVGEHQEAEWMIRSLKSDIRLREAKIERLSGDYESLGPAVNEELWPLEDIRTN